MLRLKLPNTKRFDMCQCFAIRLHFYILCRTLYWYIHSVLCSLIKFLTSMTLHLWTTLSIFWQSVYCRSPVLCCVCFDCKEICVLLILNVNLNTEFLCIYILTCTYCIELFFVSLWSQTLTKIGVHWNWIFSMSIIAHFTQKNSFIHLFIDKAILKYCSWPHLWLDSISLFFYNPSYQTPNELYKLS